MSRPIFIRDQGLQILVGTDIDLNFQLHPSRFRGLADKPVSFGPQGEAAESAADWVPLAQSLRHLPEAQQPDDATPISDADALLYRLDPSLARAAGMTVDAAERLHRLVVIADSGNGKTVRLNWLRMELSRRKSRYIPFLLNIDQIPESDKQFMQMLLKQMRVAGNDEEAWPDDVALATLKRWRNSGRILLLLDAADQIRQMNSLQNLLTKGFWKHCPVVVSGRPEVIHTHRSSFQPEFGFQFVRPMELTDDQLQTYMGPERYALLPDDMEDAAEVLRNPRVAWYLGYVIPVAELQSLKSASDVFESATSHLLTEGLKSQSAWKLGTAVTQQERTDDSVPPPGFQPNHGSQIERGHRLLSAIAFEQMLLPPEESDPEVGEPADLDVPNFSGVDNDELPGFLTRVFERVKAHDDRYSSKETGRDLFNFDMERLSAANAVITRGLLDVASLFREIRWRNKSLQEFYAARWLANYATDDDIQYLTERRYHPLQRQTFWFYWVERYLCEMPRRAGEQVRWAHAVEPFYRPGDGTIRGTHRSCEMIHRAWPRLQKNARRNTHELTVRDRFLRARAEIN